MCTLEKEEKERKIKNRISCQD